MTATPARTPQPPSTDFFTHRLPNGLTLLGQHMPDVSSVACSFYVKAGARDEQPALSGVSHFLEHMVFKGTATRTGPDIDRTFEELGAEHNAGTSTEYTYYWAKVLGENLVPTIDLLADMMSPCLAPADLDAERSVILQEIARGEDVPDRVLMRALLEGFFAGHPLANSVLGSRESIGAMTVEGMRDYWQRHYGAENILFSIAGNFDWPAVCDQIERLCGGWRAGATPRSLEAQEAHDGLIVLTRDTMQHQILAAALPHIADGDSDRFVADVVATVLGDHTGSRLYWGVRERGLAQVAGADISQYDHAGMLMVYLNAEPASVPAAWEAARRELARLQEEGVAPDELARAKTKLASRMVLDGESSTQRMLSLLASWTSVGRLETLDDDVAAIDGVTRDDCRRLLDRFPLTRDPLVVTLGPLPEHAFAG
jgi:predicted Zn-dependent peptidase